MTEIFFEYLLAVGTPVAAVIGLLMADSWHACRDVRLF